MTAIDTNTNESIVTLTADIVAAHLSHNSVKADEVAGLIQSVHSALSKAGSPAPAEPEPVEYTPATTARKSLADPNVIVSMIDGKPYKSLKRHIGRHGLTFTEYRTRYNLPADYPSVAESYSASRREIAKKLGLGRKKVADATETVTKPARKTLKAALGKAREHLG